MPNNVTASISASAVGFAGSVNHSEIAQSLLDANIAQLLAGEFIFKVADIVTITSMLTAVIAAVLAVKSYRKSNARKSTRSCDDSQ